MKKKKRRRVWILLLLIGCVILFFAWHSVGKKQTAVSYDTKWVNRCEVKELLRFTGISEDTLDAYIKESRPHLTYGDVESLLEHLQIKDYVNMPKKKWYQTISRNDFFQIYDEMREILDTDGVVKTKKLLVLSVQKESKNFVIETQEGTFQTDLPQKLLASYDGIRAYLRGDTLIGIGNKTEEVTMENAFLKEEQKQAVSVLYDGKTFTFPVETLSESVQGSVCDLCWKQGNIVKIRKKEDTIEGNLLSMDEKQMEIEGYGSLKRAKKLPIYKTYGTVEEKSSSDIVLGNMKVRYVVGNKKICAALLVKPADLKKIRVLLLQNGAPVAKDLFLTADQPYVITYGKKKIKKNANEVTAVSKLEFNENGGCQKFTTKNGQFRFADTPEQLSGRGYEGSMEVRKCEDGYALVNVLNVEQYLYHVVPSEMPPKYGIEALKVQALCARSYAYIQMNRGDYARYGAHIDDTVNYQVYNQQETTDEVKRAVDDTCGQVLTHQGNIIEAYYFSTSCGETDTLAAWSADGKEEKETYLKHAHVNQTDKGHDLSKEKAFRAYIQSGDDTAYDRDSTYFRWSGTLDFSNSSEHVKHTITVRREARPESFTFLDPNQNQVEWIEKNFGALKGFVVKKRAKCGSIRVLQVIFENGTVNVTSEYTIRLILACGEETLMGQNNTEITMHELLPSAFVCWDDLGGLRFQVYGGGYGHGIGMSQTAAGKMAEEGMSCDEILNFFYHDIERTTQAGE
ncbi:MAG: SpoIID/LytB domain-containing protein [Lachnospiraceae bacterium]